MKTEIKHQNVSLQLLVRPSLSHTKIKLASLDAKVQIEVPIEFLPWAFTDLNVITSLVFTAVVGVPDEEPLALPPKPKFMI